MKKALCFVEIPITGGLVPEWVELIPAGLVTGRDGRQWNNDNPDGIVAAFSQNRAALPIDTEHSTDKLAPQGLPAPASGWMEAIENRNGAIWARVSWTPEGRDSVQNRQYRFLSPVFYYDQKTQGIRALSSAALTNKPNLLLPSLNREEKEKPIMKDLLKALGLPETAPEVDAVAALNRIQTDLSTARNAAPPLDKYVPRADYDAALARAANSERSLAAQAKARQDSEIEAAVSSALKAGKITPATADYHKAQCRTEGGLERFNQFVAAAPTVGAASGLDGKKPTGGDQPMDEIQKAINAQLGISDADWAKYNPKA